MSFPYFYSLASLSLRIPWVMVYFLVQISPIEFYDLH